MTSIPKENIKLSEYTENEILAELEHILSSDLFSRSSVLSNFLKFIVEETLKGNTDELKEYTIAVGALGKSDDFNPQIDAIVRIHAGRLRRLLNEYYLGPGIKDALKIEVVKGTYVPMFRVQLINQPNNTKPEPVVKVDTNASNKPVVYSRSKLTLAILPFRNLCPDDEYQFFVDGFGEELTRIFSTFHDIAVVAHYSTLRYAKNYEDIRVIGSNLGVHYLINGSVKRSSKEIIVNVGLLETMNGMQIWTKTYTHNLKKDQIIDIQDQINNDVFAILSGEYGFIVRDTIRIVDNEMKQDLQSFDAILWNYRTQVTHSVEDYMKSRKALEKALQNDPNNVMCLVVLGDTYLFSYSLGYTDLEDPVNEAYKLISKALRIAPLSQYAHLIHGWANIYLGKKKEAIEAFEYTLQLGPTSSSDKGGLGFGFACVGEYSRSLTLLQEAIDLNPYCPWWYYMGFFFDYYQKGNFKEALKYAQKIDVSEDVFLQPLLRAAVMGKLGLHLEAQADVKTLNEKFPEIVANLNSYLRTFLLDQSLVDEIINGAKKVGLN